MVATPTNLDAATMVSESRKARTSKAATAASPSSAAVEMRPLLQVDPTRRDATVLLASTDAAQMARPRQKDPSSLDVLMYLRIDRVRIEKLQF